MKTVRFLNADCTVKKASYLDGSPALLLVDPEDGSPIARATVNIPGVPLAKNQVLIKSHSENTGLLEALTEAGIVKPTGQMIRSGFVEIPVCALQPPFREVSHAERVEKGSGRAR